MPKDNEAVIKLRAEVAGLKKDLGNANKQIKGFKDKATKSFDGLGKTIVQVFGAQQIFQFIKSGISDFAEMERSLDNLGRKVEQTGTAWGEAGEEVKAYISQVQEATRFGDDQALSSLDRIISLTGDYNSALQLNERAMDLAVFANMDLGRASEIVALSFQSNTEGLTALGKELGLTTEESKDAEKMFGLLDEKAQGLARSEETTATALTQAKNAMADGAKMIGEKLAPAILFLAKLFAEKLPKAIDMVVRAAETYGLIWGRIFAGAILLVEKIKDEVKDFSKFLQTVWKNPKKAWDKFQADSLATRKKHDAASRYLEEEFSADMAAIWKKDAEDKKKIDEDSLRAKIKIKKKELDATKKIAKSEADYYRENMKSTVSLMAALTTQLSDNAAVYTQKAGETNEMFVARVTEQEALVKAKAASTFAAIQTFAAGATAAFAENFALWTEQMIEGTFNIGAAFERLAKSMLKFLLESLGQGLIQEAAGMMARSIAASLGIITAFAAPGLMAGAAKLAAAGGIMMGVAGAIKLAEGGIAMGPTNAIIGEGDEPEVVAPLSKLPGLLPRGAGGGLSIKNLNMYFTKVKNMDDLKTTRFSETAARELAKVNQDLNQRGGVKRGRA